jgi:hypothetical protein
VNSVPPLKIAADEEKNLLQRSRENREAKEDSMQRGNEAIPFPARTLAAGYAESQS